MITVYYIYFLSIVVGDTPSPKKEGEFLHLTPQRHSSYGERMCAYVCVCVRICVCLRSSLLPKSTPLSQYA
jgi:hypothetical protein